MHFARGRQPAAIALGESAKKLKIDARGAPADVVRELASLVKALVGEAAVWSEAPPKHTVARVTHSVSSARTTRVTHPSSVGTRSQTHPRPVPTHEPISLS
jgi:hypothetical protein